MQFNKISTHTILYSLQQFAIHYLVYTIQRSIQSKKAMQWNTLRRREVRERGISVYNITIITI